jgi:hypothetical protein
MGSAREETIADKDVRFILPRRLIRPEQNYQGAILMHGADGIPFPIRVKVQ